MSSKRAGGAEVTSSTAKKQCTKPSEPNWQASLKTPVDRLAEIYKCSRLTDLTISFPGREKLKVHRLILAITSPVFECMLYGPMAEGNELELPEDPLDAFKWLLQYIYCGIKEFPDVSTAVQVYRLAHKYQIDDLSLLCSQYLQDHLDGDNLPLIYETASVLEDKDLLEECDMVMSYSAEFVLSSDNIGLLSRGCMQHFMETELSISSEVAVYNGLIKWGRAQEIQTKGKQKPKGLRNIVNEFLPFINFLSMSLDEYLVHVGPSNILTSDESLAILMNIKKVKDIPLPQLCKQTGSRCVLERENIQTVSLTNLVSYYLPEELNAVYRQQMISDLKVSENICLGSIEVCFGSPVNHHKWIIEVKDAFERTVKKVKFNNSGKPSPFSNSTTNSISSLFSPPLLLRPGKLYNIWIHSTLYKYESKEFCVQYGGLKFTGSIWQAVETKIHFCYFEKNAQNEELSDEEQYEDSDDSYEHED